MSDVRLSDSYFHFVYDPSVRGYNELFWKTLTGAPSVVSNEIRLNASSITSSGEYLYGTFEFRLNVATVPTIDDARVFGLKSSVLSDAAYFEIKNKTIDEVPSNVLVAVSKDGTTTEETNLTWDAAWTAADTLFSIKWYKERVEFWIAGSKVATHFTSVPTPRALPLYFSNSNADNLDIGFIAFQQIHKVEGFDAEPDYEFIQIRSAAILTNGWVAGTVLGPSNFPRLINKTKMVVYIDFTKGSLTDGQVKVEFSNDGTDYYQETSQAIVTGVDTMTPLVHKMTADGKCRLLITIKDRYVKISATGTGTVDNSSMKISASVSAV